MFFHIVKSQSQCHRFLCPYFKLVVSVMRFKLPSGCNMSDFTDMTSTFQTTFGMQSHELVFVYPVHLFRLNIILVSTFQLTKKGTFVYFHYQKPLVWKNLMVILRSFDHFLKLRVTTTTFLQRHLAPPMYIVQPSLILINDSCS